MLNFDDNELQTVENKIQALHAKLIAIQKSSEFVQIIPIPITLSPCEYYCKKRATSVQQKCSNWNIDLNSPSKLNNHLQKLDELIKQPIESHTTLSSEYFKLSQKGLKNKKTYFDREDKPIKNKVAESEYFVVGPKIKKHKFISGFKKNLKELIQSKWQKFRSDSNKMEYSLRQRSRTVETPKLILKKSWKPVKFIFEDSKYPNQKHEQSHLLNTFWHQTKMRHDIIQNLCKHYDKSVQRSNLKHQYLR